MQRNESSSLSRGKSRPGSGEWGHPEPGSKALAQFGLCSTGPTLPQGGLREVNPILQQGRTVWATFSVQRRTLK